jgi:hypothetical protein
LNYFRKHVSLLLLPILLFMMFHTIQILAQNTTSADFPVSSDALKGKYICGKSDGFIMKFNLESNMPVYLSFICDSKSDFINYVDMTNEQKYVLVGSSSSKDFPVIKDALYQSIDGGMDLVILIMDKTFKNIEYSTYGGGSKQLIMMPSVNYVKGGKLLIAFTNYYQNFPVTMKYAEPDSTGTNCLLKLDMNG